MVAGEGFTIVVLVTGLGEAAVVVVVVGATSVRCSHAVSSAALARMQIDFFIGLVGFARGGITKNRSNGAVRPCLTKSS